jgi:hypothetical protein
LLESFLSLRAVENAKLSEGECITEGRSVTGLLGRSHDLDIVLLG